MGKEISFPYRRILIIGGNGAGKTTLAVALGECLQLPIVHLDRLYWQDIWQTTPREAFLAAMEEELQKPQWIMDGTFRRTLPTRLAYADCVIHLDFSTFACLCGVVRRILRYRGKSRPDMGGECVEGFNRRSRAFLVSIWRMNRTNRREFYQLTEASGLPVIRLHNRRQVNQFIRKMKTDLQ